MPVPSESIALPQQPEHGCEDFLPLQLLLMKIGLAGGGSLGFGTSYATRTRRYNLLADLPSRNALELQLNSSQLGTACMSQPPRVSALSCLISIGSQPCCVSAPSCWQDWLLGSVLCTEGAQYLHQILSFSTSCDTSQAFIQHSAQDLHVFCCSKWLFSLSRPQNQSLCRAHPRAAHYKHLPTLKALLGCSTSGRNQLLFCLETEGSQLATLPYFCLSGHHILITVSLFLTTVLNLQPNYPYLVCLMKLI